MGKAVREGIVQPDVLSKNFGLTIGSGDHLPQCPFLEKTDLAELLISHLFIRHALEFFGARLVDDMGNLLFGELATDLFFLSPHGHVALL